MEQAQLGLFLRDAGIAAADAHAERVHPGWGDIALGYVKEYCCYHRQFTGEDIRLYAEQRGIEQPPHKRAWGGVMVKAARAGLIAKIGTAQVTNPKAHRAIATLWRSIWPG